MKKLLIVGLVGLSTMLLGCGGEPELTAAQKFELDKLKMQQQHELNMTRAQQHQQQYAAPQPVSTYEPQYAQPAPQHNVDSASYGNQPVESGSSDSGIGDTLLAVAGGALAGYAISELLDDGYRSYTDKSGKSVYVDKNGRQIDKRDYDAYKAKHPTKHKLSSYNQQGKQAINTGATKTVNAVSTVKTKVDQKVVKPVQKKVSSVKKSTSKRR